MEEGSRLQLARSQKAVALSRLAAFMFMHVEPILTRDWYIGRFDL